MQFIYKNLKILHLEQKKLLFCKYLTITLTEFGYFRVFKGEILIFYLKFIVQNSKTCQSRNLQYPKIPLCGRLNEQDFFVLSSHNVLSNVRIKILGSYLLPCRIKSRYIKTFIKAVNETKSYYSHNVRTKIIALICYLDFQLLVMEFGALK